ncbi:hypothetical protein B4Q13_17560, partial [Lacticaseibacillus rhamnosus]
KPADARLMKIQPDRPLVLASGSPRRRQLLEQAGYVFTVRRYEAAEDFAPDMPPEKVASFLAAKKASHFREGIGDEIIITADTVVILDNQVLNKPADSVDAIIGTPVRAAASAPKTLCIALRPCVRSSSRLDLNTMKSCE